MKRLLCGITAAALAFLGGCTKKAEHTEISEVQGGTTVYCFQAGKADAHLIYNDGCAVLIDCGEKGFGKHITAYMEEHGIESLDYLIITHFDKDHVGGAAKVMREMEIGAVLQSNSPKESEEYTEYTEQLAASKLEPVTVSERMSFTVGGMEVTVDPPAQEEYAVDPSNNSSLITEISIGEKAMLFAGDAQDDRLAEYTSANDKHYDFLKVPYHGHYQKNLQAFVKDVSPSLAVITSSDDEPEDDDAVNILQHEGAEVYLTREAPVIVRCDGTKIACAYDKENTE